MRERLKILNIKYQVASEGAIQVEKTLMPIGNFLSTEVEMWGGKCLTSELKTAVNSLEERSRHRLIRCSGREEYKAEYMVFSS